MDIVKLADAFATAAHAAVGQTRKYTGEPYIVHPRRVMRTLVDIGINDPDVLASALLHDVVEDTNITSDLILEVFGSRVQSIVASLTDTAYVMNGANRRARKEMDRARLAQSDSLTQTIKVADLIDNSVSILAHDPKFAKVYIAEKKLLLDVLVLADPTLVAQARSQVDG